MGLNSLFERKLFPLYRHSIAQIHELKYIFFEVTQKCNLTCLHCGSDCQSSSQAPDLPTEAILDVLKQIKTKHNSRELTVAISGGEPLCYNEIWELGQEISNLEFPWGMVTNGLAWKPETLVKANAARMGSVTVSLDGFDEDHNWLRGNPNSFRKAVDTIKLFLSDDYQGIIDVVTCVNTRNLSRLDEFHDFLADLGLTQWRLFLVSPIGRALKYPELILDGKQLSNMFDRIAEYRKKRAMHVTYSESGHLGVELEKTVRDHRYFCLAGINVAGIMVNGDILACPNIDRRFSQGNIFRDSFVDIWENGYQQFRNRKWMKTGQCSSCDQWPLCQGNSFHLWDLDNNKSRYCHFKLLNPEK